LRIVFMGTPDFAVPTLLELIGHGHEIVAVYTQPPRPAGRGLDLVASPVERAARRFAIPVLSPKSLKGVDEQAAFAEHGAEVAVVVAYGLILPPAVLAAPVHGCLNLHGSLLPRWRGAAPIQRAIMAGDAETGVMVMRMDKGLDTGPVAMTERVAIGRDETAGELAARLSRLGADLMGRAVAALSRGSLAATPQPEEGATYAAKIDKAEARIVWSEPAAAVHNRIRGLTPVPGAWCELPGPRGLERVKVLKAHPVAAAVSGAAPGTVLDDRLTIACGDGALGLLELQRAGGKPLAVADFLKGLPVPAGTLCP
jgi:methionyl-tRNA formyltransferase